MSTMDYYRVFYQAVRHGSISRAAEKLFMTQPSASYAIKQLEEQLGVPLLIRRAKGVTATEEGKALFGYVEQAFRSIQTGEQKVEEMKAMTSGIVHLGASDSLIKQYLLPFLDRFRKEHPGIRICLSHGKSAEIAERLLQGEIDCGIVHLPVDDKLHVQASRIVQDCFVAGPGFAETIRTPMRLQELVHHPFVLLSTHSRTRSFLQALMQTQGLDVMPDIELGSVDLLIEFVRRDMGISLISRDFVAEQLAAGSLIEIPTVEAIPARSIGLVTMPGAALSTASAWFVKELARHLAP